MTKIWYSQHKSRSPSPRDNPNTVVGIKPPAIYFHDIPGSAWYPLSLSLLGKRKYPTVCPPLARVRKSACEAKLILILGNLFRRCYQSRFETSRWIPQTARFQFRNSTGNERHAINLSLRRVKGTKQTEYSVRGLPSRWAPFPTTGMTNIDLIKWPQSNGSKSAISSIPSTKM